MPLIRYIDWDPSHRRRMIIEQASEIIRDYKKQGFDLTLRQLFYQFVSRDYLPNTERSYFNLGEIISKARLAGMIDWNSIIDRTRKVRSVSHFDNPADLIETARDQYHIDKWQGQAHYVEVWIEKDALVGVIEPVCRELDVAWFSCRGYTSQSELWRASQRLVEKVRDEARAPVILHLGDHDPSGIDMTRDIRERLELFLEEEADNLIVRRIAFNMDQIEEFEPPPNPTKVTDSRANGYIALYGHECWELDALEPAEIQKLIRVEVLSLRDEEAWAKMVARENGDRDELDNIIADLGERDG